MVKGFSGEKENKTKSRMNIKKLLFSNAKNIFYAITWGILVYIILFRDNNKNDGLYKEKLSNIEKGIQNVESSQKKVNSQIELFNLEIDKLQNKIDELEGEKTVIKEIYYEKINNVSKYSDKQLDSFFTERYGYSTK